MLPRARCMTTAILRLALLPPIAAMTASSPLAAQQPRADRPAALVSAGHAVTPLLLLGVFHFRYPGQDVHSATVRVDVLSPERQREVLDVVERLAAFRPTKIAVEVSPDRQASLDSTYQAYLAGRHVLTADETQQLGFRLAQRLGHARLYAVDAQPSAAFAPIFQQVEANEAALDTVDGIRRQHFIAGYTRDDSLSARQTLREHLRYLNAPDHVRQDHGSYSVGWFKLEGADGYLGADFRTAWYNRNLRIFRNLQRLTSSSDDRVLLIIGAGHLPILGFVAASSPEFRLADLERYLGPSRR